MESDKFVLPPLLSVHFEKGLFAYYLDGRGEKEKGGFGKDW